MDLNNAFLLQIKEIKDQIIEKTMVLAQHKDQSYSHIKKMIEKEKSSVTSEWESTREKIMTNKQVIYDDSNDTKKMIQFRTNMSNQGDNDEIRMAVSVYNEDYMKESVVELREKMLKLKAFLGLNWWYNKCFWKKKLHPIKDRVLHRQLLISKLEDLTQYEKSTKFEISEAQKVIAQLEIENNLFRKEIHNSQFSRIKMLKEFNAEQQKIDEKKFMQKSMKKDKFNKSPSNTKRDTVGVPSETNIIMSPVLTNTTMKAQKSLYAENVFQKIHKAKGFSKKKKFDNHGMLNQPEESQDYI